MTAANPFPGGVADEQGRHAVVQDREGRLVAVALDEGRILWRSREPLRPLLVAGGEVIALREQPPGACVAFALAGAGSAAWASAALGLPDWIAESDAQLEAAAALRGAVIEISWRARARYRGGAAPGPRVREAAARDAEGVAEVDRASGTVTARAAPVELPGAAAQAPAAADVLEQRRIGDRTYQRVVERAPGAVLTSLRALDAAGVVRWQVVIDEAQPRAPRPLRQ